jgi:hypothetical protein
VDVDRVEKYLQELIVWASTRPDIQGVAVVGSYARGAATESSDVDLIILALHPEQLIRDRNWIRIFGKISRQQIEEYGGLSSIRVWYSDGREIEYGITHVSWADVPLDQGTHRVISNGMRILFERRQILSQHLYKS